MIVNLPPKERYWLFQLTNLFSHFSITPFQMPIDLLLAPKGIPKYVVGRSPVLTPKILVREGKLGISFTGYKKLLYQLM